MNVLEYRTWIIFYLISFTALLWALFLSTQGVLLWISLTLDIVVMGVNGGFLLGEIRAHQSRKRHLKEILCSDDGSPLVLPSHHR